MLQTTTGPYEVYKKKIKKKEQNIKNCATSPLETDGTLKNFVTRNTYEDRLITIELYHQSYGDRRGSKQQSNFTNSYFKMFSSKLIIPGTSTSSLVNKRKLLCV